MFCTFNRVTGLNYSVGKDGSRKPLVDDNGENLPTVTVNKGEKSFPIFLTSFTVVNRETKEKPNTRITRNSPMKRKRSITSILS